MMKRMAILTSVGVLALSSAELAVGRLMRGPGAHGGDDRDDAETRTGAAAAGGYDQPRRSEPPESAPTASTTQPDVGAARNDDSFEGGIDAKDRDRITSQEAREAAGPFTGTGNQDALRTAGRQGGTDANHADQRTVEADAKDNTNKEADKATRESAKEQRQERDS